MISIVLIVLAILALLVFFQDRKFERVNELLELQKDRSDFTDRVVNKVGIRVDLVEQYSKDNMELFRLLNTRVKEIESAISDE